MGGVSVEIANSYYIMLSGTKKKIRSFFVNVGYILCKKVEHKMIHFCKSKQTKPLYMYIYMYIIFNVQRIRGSMKAINIGSIMSR